MNEKDKGADTIVWENNPFRPGCIDLMKSCAEALQERGFTKDQVMVISNKMIALPEFENNSLLAFYCLSTMTHSYYAAVSHKLKRDGFDVEIIARINEGKN